MSFVHRTWIACFSFLALIGIGFAVSGTTFAQRRMTVSTVSAAPSGTPILTEDFDYAAGAILTSNGWSAHSSGGTNTIVASTPGLSFTGYPGSGVGNAASLTSSGEDINKSFTTQTSGSVYAAAMVQVTAATTTGDYFIHLINNPLDTNYRARVFAKRDASNNVAFGISKTTTTDASIAWTPFSYALNTTYLVVLKYQIVDSTSNDVVSLFVINGSIASSEPAATATATDNTTASDVSPGYIALRQGTAGNGLNVKIDGVRVGTAWDSVTQASAATQRPVVDFNGDGKTDFSVVRTSGGNLIWYTSINGTGVASGAQWGLAASDRLTPADFDGDGKADIAVWREAPAQQAAFYILQSSDSTFKFQLFGQTGDDPSVTADYDGDGKADPAVFRCPTGTAGQCYFFYRGSLSNAAGNITYVPWGAGLNHSTIFPVSGDFNGDGKYDFCVFYGNAGAGIFAVLYSSNLSFQFTQWGLSTDQVIPRMDYDGDGKADFALARPDSSTYNLYVLTQTGGGTGASPIKWAALSDNAAFGDYDGDGKTDVGIWRSSNGTFYIIKSSDSSLLTFQWGTNGDLPTAEWIFPMQD